MTHKAPNPKDQWTRHLRWSLVLGHLLVIGHWSLILLLFNGCDRRASVQSPPSTTRAVALRVASLVPAATDLILGMNAGEHLVAVSNWDPKLPQLDGLP